MKNKTKRLLVVTVFFYDLTALCKLRYRTVLFHCCVALQVSLGKCNELLAADFTADKLPADCQSVKGLGRVAPDAEDTYTM